jgi:hypothetical protein
MLACESIHTLNVPLLAICSTQPIFSIQNIHTREDIMQPRTRLIKIRLMLYITILFTFMGCGGPAGLQNGALDPSTLSPGLSVLYFEGKYRFVKEMPKGSWAKDVGSTGQPVLVLNHQFGDGEIYDSGRSQKVGVQLEGFIHLAKQGKYAFQALSNDGVEIYINGELIVSDPRVHGDKLSEAGEVFVNDAGWKSFLVRYFQRKGTAALKFYWRSPGSHSFEIVPEEAYGHL